MRANLPIALADLKTIPSAPPTDRTNPTPPSAAPPNAAKQGSPHRIPSKCIAVASAIAVVVVVSLALGLGLGLKPESEEPTQIIGEFNSTDLRLLRLASCTELTTRLAVSPAYATTSTVQLSARYTEDLGGFPTFDMVALEGASAPSSGESSAPESAGSFSTTNVQVQGIDEADLVKNDGRYIYSVGGAELVVVQAHPLEERGVRSRTSLSDGLPQGANYSVVVADEALLLSAESRLVVLLTAQVEAQGRSFAAVLVQTWDVSDASAPQLLQTHTFEGRYQTARLIGSHVYLAISTSARATVDGASDDEAVMPVASSASASARAGFSPAASCSSVELVEQVQPRSLLLLASVSAVSGERVASAVAAVGSAYGEAAVMATAGSIYVASYNSEWVCSDSGCGGWWCGFARDSSCTFSEVSGILVYDVDGATGALERRAAGSVPGYLLSQWAMSEHEGHLRVAYTKRSCGWWGGGECTDNCVDVLRASDLALPSEASRVAGLGLGETIYAVRFEGPVAFVVTFRRTDPLYTLDLADPLAPRVLGELKITGYSDNLHLISPTTLLGVGREATEGGRLLGIKLALFNVTDMAHPTELASVSFGGTGSSSPVEKDHRALLFSPSRSLLVVPLTERGDSWSCLPPSFHGARAFDLSRLTFSELAAIEHAPGRSSEAWMRQWNDSDYYNNYYSPCYSAACAAATIRRSLYIGDELYTLSDGLLQATSMRVWKTTLALPLHSQQVLAREGSCTLGGQSLPWDRVAASGADIYCASRSYSKSECGPADSDLRGHECDLLGRSSFTNLLNGARNCCGNQTCACETSYAPCQIWY